MDLLEQAAKVCEITPERLFLEICESQNTGERRWKALAIGYFGNRKTGCNGEKFLPPFVQLSCEAILLGTVRRPARD